jgi:hypothetical protein
MQPVDSILDALKGVRDIDRQRTIARKVALNEAYFNVGIIDVIGTKTVTASKSDRNKLILALKTESREAFDVYNIDKGFFGKFILKAKGIFGGGDQDPEDKFTGWTETELHHYVVVKIDILKALVAADLAGESKLRIDQRVNNIKHAIIALIDSIGT